MALPNPFGKTLLAKKPIAAAKPKTINERVASSLAPPQKITLAKKPLDLRTNEKPGYVVKLSPLLEARISGDGNIGLDRIVKSVGRAWLDTVDPIGVVHKKKSFLKDVTDPVGTLTEKIDPRIAAARKQAGVAGAVGLTAGFVSSAVGLGAGGATGDVAFRNKGGPLDFLDSISDTLGDIGGILDKGRGLLDSFGGSNGSPEVPPQTVVVQQKLPVGLLVGGGVGVLILVLVLTRRR